MPPVAHRVCFGFSWQDRVGKKPSVKADQVIYSYIVTVSINYHDMIVYHDSTSKYTMQNST